jgi:hypothetical protein
MTGYHEVRVFPYFPDTGVPLKLPEGWKPFDSYMAFDSYERITLNIVARRWHRSESSSTL